MSRSIYSKKELPRVYQLRGMAEDEFSEEWRYAMDRYDRLVNNSAPKHAIRKAERDCEIFSNVASEAGRFLE